jgi:hypothetical protein
LEPVQLLDSPTIPRHMRTHFPNCFTISLHRYKTGTMSRPNAIIKRPIASAKTVSAMSVNRASESIKRSNTSGKTASIKTTVNATKEKPGDR